MDLNDFTCRLFEITVKSKKSLAATRRRGKQLWSLSRIDGDGFTIWCTGLIRDVVDDSQWRYRVIMDETIIEATIVNSYGEIQAFWRRTPTDTALVKAALLGVLDIDK